MSITLPEGSKLIFKCVAGSFLYGTNTPESDIDERGDCQSTRGIKIGKEGNRTTRICNKGSTKKDWRSH